VKTEKVNRFEIVDHSPCAMCHGKSSPEEKPCVNCNGMGSPGRRVVFWDDSKQIELHLQDDDRTLKVFISERTNG
jgi:hypothetical protein